MKIVALVTVAALPAVGQVAHMNEPVLGEGGFLLPPPGFLATLAKICRERGIVFIADHHFPEQLIPGPVRADRLQQPAGRFRRGGGALALISGPA